MGLMHPAAIQDTVCKYVPVNRRDMPGAYFSKGTSLGRNSRLAVVELVQLKLEELFAKFDLAKKQGPKTET